MERLMITAELQTPLITGGGYMTFDALLAGILFDQLQDVEAAQYLNKHSYQASLLNRGVRSDGCLRPSQTKSLGSITNT